MDHPYGDVDPFAPPPALASIAEAQAAHWIPGIKEPDPWASASPVEATPGIHLEILGRIKAAFQEMRQLASPADSEVADVLGEVRAIEKLLSTWRQGLTKETPKVEGKAYKVTESREAERSFNTAAILITAARGRPLDVTIRELIAEKAVRLEWLWQPRGGGGLKQYFSAHQLELRIAGKEVADDGDLDGPHVGEVWSQHSDVRGIPGGSE